MREREISKPPAWSGKKIILWGTRDDKMKIIIYLYIRINIRVRVHNIHMYLSYLFDSLCI